MGESGTDPLSLEEIFEKLPTSLRGFFQKVIDGVRGALQVALIDTLVGEFHEKFNAMWNAPGDRDAAKALRQCDRTHRETAAKVVNEVLLSQLKLLAMAVAGTGKINGYVDGNIPESMISILESKVARLEEQISAIEGIID